MRYYEVYYPGEDEPYFATNVRSLRDLPEGTRIQAIITERDGSLAETYKIPVEKGRAVINKRGKHRAKLA